MTTRRHTASLLTTTTKTFRVHFSARNWNRLIRTYTSSSALPRPVSCRKHRALHTHTHSHTQTNERRAHTHTKHVHTRTSVAVIKWYTHAHRARTRTNDTRTARGSDAAAVKSTSGGAVAVRRSDGRSVGRRGRRTWWADGTQPNGKALNETVDGESVCRRPCGTRHHHYHCISLLRRFRKARCCGLAVTAQTTVREVRSRRLEAPRWRHRSSPGTIKTRVTIFNTNELTTLTLYTLLVVRVIWEYFVSDSAVIRGRLLRTVPVVASWLIFFYSVFNKSCL